MGGALDSASETVFRAHAVGVARGSAELVVNGVIEQRRHVEGIDAWIRFRLEPRSCGWAAVNIRDAAKHPLLIGNPIYLTCR
jgi:hypothetical protein